MQLKCLYPVHSVSALIKFHTSISKSVTVHNFGFVQGQTLQVWIPCICPLYALKMEVWNFISALTECTWTDILIALQG